MKSNALVSAPVPSVEGEKQRASERMAGFRPEAGPPSISETYRALSEFRELSQRVETHLQKLQEAADKASELQDDSRFLSRRLEEAPQGRVVDAANTAAQLGSRLKACQRGFEDTLDNDPQVRRVIRSALEETIQLARAKTEAFHPTESSPWQNLRSRCARALQALDAGVARPWKDCAPLLRGLSPDTASGAWPPAPEPEG